MKIQYEKTQGMILFFQSNELKFALAVLKGILKVLPQDFLRQAIRDVEGDLQPPRLPLINYFHCCASCFRDIDERSADTMRIEQGGDVKWKCRQCKPINPKRPA